GFGCFLDISYNKSGLAFLYHFGHGATVIGDYRRPTRHGLDHNKAKWFRPVYGEKQSVSVAQKLVFFAITDFAHPFNVRLLEHRLHDSFEISFVLSINLGCDLNWHSCLLRYFYCSICALFGRYSSKKSQIRSRVWPKAE